MQSLSVGHSETVYMHIKFIYPCTEGLYHMRNKWCREKILSSCSRNFVTVENRSQYPSESIVVGTDCYLLL